MSEAMNYKLPPLPKPDTHCFDEDTGEDVWSHSTEQIQAYAIAAIEAQGVPDGLRNALQQISDWNSHSLQLAVEHGAVGVRDFYRQIALDALASAHGETKG